MKKAVVSAALFTASIFVAPSVAFADRKKEVPDEEAATKPAERMATVPPVSAPGLQVVKGRGLVK